ncbi:MAG: sugar phosphate nucleotidyltransferase [Armatimonadetes bacterium]|nr:sugar phosphate nucleotidyltransferase [Armatimonadota bacterium]
MRGVIVAAGEGKRMRPITYWRPKPLVPVADAPIIVHIIRGFVAAGVTDICVVVGHLRDQIVAALGDGSQWGANLTYRVQEAPRGTADAVLLARDFLKDGPFMLSWGDILVPPDHYRRVVEAHEGADGVLSVNVVEDPWEGAAVYVEGGFVERIIEKPPRGASKTNFNNAGILVLPPEVLEIAATLEPSPRGELELPHAIDVLLDRGARLRAVQVNGYWSDVARPATVLEMNGVVIDHLSGGFWVDPSAQVSDGAELIMPVYVGPGVQIQAGARVGPKVSLNENCRVENGAVLSCTVLLSDCRVGPACTVSGAYVDTGVELPAGTHLPGDLERPFLLPPSK